MKIAFLENSDWHRLHTEGDAVNYMAHNNKQTTQCKV